MLRWEKQSLDDPARDEAQLRHAAVGLNFIDVYEPSGKYPRPGDRDPAEPAEKSK